MPFYDVQHELAQSVVWQDYRELGFAEIWLMDLSDAYHSAQDPRRVADLFALVSDEPVGFRRFGYWDRKPNG